jgi:hypothetical protein
MEALTLNFFKFLKYYLKKRWFQNQLFRKSDVIPKNSTHPKSPRIIKLNILKENNLKNTQTLNKRHNHELKQHQQKRQISI